RTQRWEELGIQARGPTHQLSWVYRSTGNITDFANKFLSREEEKTEAQTPQMELFQDFLTTTGPEPEVKQFPDLDEMINYVAKQIDYLHCEEGYPLSEIAVIYPQKSPEHLSGIHFPDLMMKALDRHGICSNWIASD